ncbi:radical SAM family heme chaperone HemW [Candidatus Poribacteria bacterium]|nr:radical SAM family heme chaperone HemW [Candidatus Poribacteria bacterium]MBT5534839.1 radical SAM family heme chaperone HemW [Candidatus Poribacteria bacterium]MBT5711638.1 radical SAM family heme chaperone HemW [Candidatus Poribacteria bacterium]MBT7097908.1 radical SAM family heme chaperone HemW [Candidatus Poribacteria bacterium]
MGASARESEHSKEPPVSSPRGLYIHVPFCLYRCYYCDFATSPHVPGVVDPFLESVRREAATYASADSSIASIYLGGGTPSVLSGDQMLRLLAAMRATFPVSDGVEVTVEANPETLAAAKLRAYRDAGVTRLSIGVQALDDATLKRLGRDHTAEHSTRAVRMARDADFESVSVDLIFGLPGQDSEHWSATLQDGLALRPDHISLYGLTVEPKTVFDFMRRQQTLSVPSDDQQADMYAEAIDTALAAGYEHYEISSFASPGHESRHNMTYWADESYIGLGPSACGYLAGRRYANVRGTRSYMKRVDAGDSAVVEEETLTGIDARAQTLMLGLRRLGGVRRDDYHRRYGRDIVDDFGDTMAPLEDAGLLRLSAASIRLTRRGVLLSNEVFVRLLP